LRDSFWKRFSSKNSGVESKEEGTADEDSGEGSEGGGASLDMFVADLMWWRYPVELMEVLLKD
jgi:hypothetical protein